MGLKSYWEKLKEEDRRLTERAAARKRKASAAAEIEKQRKISMLASKNKPLKSYQIFNKSTQSRPGVISWVSWFLKTPRSLTDDLTIAASVLFGVVLVWGMIVVARLPSDEERYSKPVDLVLGPVSSQPSYAVNEDTSVRSDIKIGRSLTGGSLHTSTVGEWQIATSQNKLSTCADWIAAWDKAGLTTQKYDSFSEIQSAALRLKSEIDGFTSTLRKGEKITRYSVLAAQACGILKIQ